MSLVVLDPHGELGVLSRLALERDGHDVDWRAAASFEDWDSAAALYIVSTAGAVELLGSPPRRPAAPVLVFGPPRLPTEAFAAFLFGYDEYVVWPTRTAAFHARVDELLARAGGPPATGTGSPLLHLTDRAVHPEQGVVYRGEKVIQLRPRERALLRVLIARGGGAAHRRELIREVWGREVGSRSVDNCVLALRRKLEPDPARPRHLLTVWNTGYRFVGA